MGIWVILTPIIAWLTAGLLGWSILRTPVDRMWHNIQLTTARTPDDPEQHRGFAGAVTFFGRFLLLSPIFVTLMSLPVIAGLISPAKN